MIEYKKTTKETTNYRLHATAESPVEEGERRCSYKAEWAVLDSDVRVRLASQLLASLTDEERTSMDVVAPDVIKHLKARSDALEEQVRIRASEVQWFGAHRKAMRQNMARALDVVHPELGAPEWDQLLNIAEANASVVRLVREALGKASEG